MSVMENSDEDTWGTVLTSAAGTLLIALAADYAIRRQGSFVSRVTDQLIGGPPEPADPQSYEKIEEPASADDSRPKETTGINTKEGDGLLKSAQQQLDDTPLSVAEEEKRRTERSDGGFEVLKTHPPYTPEDREEVGFETVEGRSTKPEAEHDANYRLYITPHAIRQIEKHVGWGEKTEANQVEQGGLLTGDVYCDPDRGTTFGIGRRAIPGTLAEGSMSHLRLNHETWIDMLSKLDDFLEEDPDEYGGVIGWYHTHPLHLSVFMSGTDRSTQERMFSEDWHFAIVMNPQKRVWRVFHGKDSQECLGFIMK
jgi:proteasome lid subunit RPN8/RPN11